MPRSRWLLLIVMVLLLIVYVGGAKLDLIEGYSSGYSHYCTFAFVQG